MCTLKIISIFCFISVIQAVSLKIDGTIDLDQTWSYEYRTIKSYNDTHSKPQIKEHLPKVNDASRIRMEEERLRKGEERLHRGEDRLHKEEERIHKEEERIRKEEERIRKEAEEIRVLKEHRIPDESQRAVNQSERKGQSKFTPHDIPDHFLRKFASLPTDKKMGRESDADETVWEKKNESKSDQNKKSRKKFSSETQHDEIGYDGWSDNSAEVVIDMKDFITSITAKVKKKKKKTNKLDNLESGSVNEQAASHESVKNDKGKHMKLRLRKEQLAAIINNINITPTNKIIVANTRISTKPITTEVTTIRTDEIFSAPHTVKDDEKINDFTNHLFKQTLKVFHSIKHKTNQYYLRKEVDGLAKNYEDKFREFLKDTRHQNIKTRLGTQKVVLNTIDMSNRILKRLINYMIGEMNKKGVLRNNEATADIFLKEIEKEQNMELSYACKKFGICRTGPGFPEFLTDLISSMLRSDDGKFKQSVDALTEAIKSANFYNVLNSEAERKLKVSMGTIELLDVRTLRPVMLILKNIVCNKNKPIIVDSDSEASRVNATLAFLEIIDLLDQKLPRNETNILEWNYIRNSIQDFSDGKRYGIQDIMETFLNHLKKAVKVMDLPTRNIINKNMNHILG